MKKKLKLTDFKVESFVTGLDSKIDTKNYAGGQYTLPEPGSGVCVECIVTDLNYSMECCHETAEAWCPATDMRCDNTQLFNACNDTVNHNYCGSGTRAGNWNCP